MSDAPIAVAYAAPPQRPRALEWIPLLSLLVVLVGAILGGGSLIGQLHEDGRRISALEADRDGDSRQLTEISVRLARIEGALQALRADRSMAR